LAHSPRAKRRPKLLSPALPLVLHWVLPFPAEMTKPKAPLSVASLVLLQVHTLVAAKTASVCIRTLQVSVTRLLAHKPFLLPKADIQIRPRQFAGAFFMSRGRNAER
tara:strand:- start:2105 stop:2425 length:321 start_codon:yes stop_codon:yes gene_type:complete